jgi:hypothetical protein
MKKAAAVSATAANGWIRGGAIAEKLCRYVGSLRLAIPIGHLYFSEFFRLGKLFQNDDHHSKPITKPMALSDANCRAMAADDGRQTWDPPPDRLRNSFFARWVLRSCLR